MFILLIRVIINFVSLILKSQKEFIFKLLKFNFIHFCKTHIRKKNHKKNVNNHYFMKSIDLIYEMQEFK